MTHRCWTGRGKPLRKEREMRGKAARRARQHARDLVALLERLDALLLAADNVQSLRTATIEEWT